MTMKNMKAAFAIAMAPISMTVAAPVMVQSIYVADPVRAITDAQAIMTGFQQVDTSYQANVQQLTAREKEVRDLSQTLAALDTDGDGQVTPQETAAANSSQKATLSQIETKNQEIETLQAPIYKAQVYVVEQVAKQYEAAETKVVQDKKATMLLSPDAVVWAPQSADVTGAITAELNKRVTSVQPVPPADWKPTQATVGLHQQISRTLGLRQYVAALQAAQQQQQQQQGAAPAATGESR